MLTIDDKLKIYKEAVLGEEPSITSDEALQYRATVDQDIAEMKARGITPDLPHEVPG